MPTYALLNQPRSSDSFLPSLSLSLRLSLPHFSSLFSPSECSVYPFYFLPGTAAFELDPSLSPRILIPFLRASLHANQDNAMAPGGRNELQRRKEILFLPWKRPTFSGIPITGHRYYCISFGIWAGGAEILANFSFPVRVKKIRAQTFPIININISKVCRSPRIFYGVYIFAPPKFSYLTVAKCGGNFEACFSFFFFPPKILFSFFCLPWKNLREIVFRACVGSRYICACKKFHTIPPLFRKQGATAPATPLPRIPVFITYHKLQLSPPSPAEDKEGEDSPVHTIP